MICHRPCSMLSVLNGRRCGPLSMELSTEPVYKHTKTEIVALHDSSNTRHPCDNPAKWCLNDGGPDRDTSFKFLHEQEWHWRDGVPWANIYNSHEVCMQHLLAETKYKPPDACFVTSSIPGSYGQDRVILYLTAWDNINMEKRIMTMYLAAETKFKPPDACTFYSVIGGRSMNGEKPVSLVDETKFKPPGTVHEVDKWHWCDGVPWMCTDVPNSNLDGGPRQWYMYLEVETKFRPPDTPHQM